MHGGVVALCPGVTLRKPRQESKLQLQKVHVGRENKTLVRVVQQDPRARRKHQFFHIYVRAGSDWRVARTLSTVVTGTAGGIMDEWPFSDLPLLPPPQPVTGC